MRLMRIMESPTQELEVALLYGRARGWGSYMQGKGREGALKLALQFATLVSTLKREGKGRGTEIEKGREEEGAFHVGTNWQKVHN